MHRSIFQNITIIMYFKSLYAQGVGKSVHVPLLHVIDEGPFEECPGLIHTRFKVVPEGTP